jgi:hemerythrin-like domain-containing protein
MCRLTADTLPAATYGDRMNALDDLTQEHRLIERMIAALEGAAVALRRGAAVSPEALAGAIEFVRGFADGCHHGKEEHLLFPVLAAKHKMLKDGPVKVLTAEHEVGRKLMRDLERAVVRMRDGDAAAGEAAAKAIETYARMLRKHIAKEEQILFPVAEQVIAPAEAAQLAEQFDEHEASQGIGAHERYEALVTRVEAAIAAAAA